MCEAYLYEYGMANLDSPLWDVVNSLWDQTFNFISQFDLT